MKLGDRLGKRVEEDACLDLFQQGGELEHQRQIVGQLVAVDLQAIALVVLAEVDQGGAAVLVVAEQMVGEVQGMLRRHVEGLDVARLCLGQIAVGKPGGEVGDGLALGRGDGGRFGERCHQLGQRPDQLLIRVFEQCGEQFEQQHGSLLHSPR